MQVAGDAYVQQQVRAVQKAELSDVQKVASASVAGACSGLVAGPSELVMLAQQQNGASLLKATKAVFAAHGLRGLLRGVGPTMVRDGGFAAGYLGLKPVLHEKLKAQAAAASGVVAGLAAGVATAAVTHPFSVVKTYLQNDLQRAQYKNSVAVARSLCQLHGLKGFFKGFTPRATRVVSALMLMSKVKEMLTQYLQKGS